MVDAFVATPYNVNNMLPAEVLGEMKTAWEGHCDEYRACSTFMLQMERNVTRCADEMATWGGGDGCPASCVDVAIGMGPGNASFI